MLDTELIHQPEFTGKFQQRLKGEGSSPEANTASTTVGDVIRSAIKAIDLGRRRTKGASTERVRLLSFLRNYPELCGSALVDATEDMFEDWMADRLETVKPNTLLRELRLLKPLFAVATRKFHLYRSPLQYLNPPRVIDERVRRISSNEEALLFAELERSRGQIVSLAARFALETGCRRSEQLRLHWADYDAVAGTVWLADAKNGRGRYILLTQRAQGVVESLRINAKDANIFPVTGNQLKKAFEYARGRAAGRACALGRSDLLMVETLRWHDFRHEAISRCFDAGWTSEQVMDFSGHVDLKSLLRYRHSKVDENVARLRALETLRRSSPTAAK